MIKTLINRPIAVIVSFFALLILGFIASMKLPISLLPNLEIPILFVRIDAPNMSSHETEQRITKPLRKNLLQIQGLSNIETVSSEGFGSIKLSFNHDINVSMAFIEVNEKIDMAMNSFPKEISRPKVIKSTVSDIPVFRLNIYASDNKQPSSDFVDISTFTREIIRRRIEQIPEVAMVDMTGFVLHQVEIIPKRGYLESLGITEETLLATFRENTISLGTVLIQDGHYRYYLRFSSELQTLDAVGKIPLNINGRLLILSDVVDINFSSNNTEGFYQSNGKQSVNLAIIKQPTARMEDLKRSFHIVLKKMKEDYPNVVFEVSQDQTHLLDSSVSNLQQDLALGGVLAFFSMMVFIRKIRTSLLIGITMPFSLIISLLGFYAFGISINILSLGGLILGLSMIIDNSIVVVDTITSYRNAGYSVKKSAELGTREMSRPLVTSVITNCAVFIPLIFLSDLAGAIFYEQAISIVLGVMSSLFVAIFLLPPLYVLTHSDTKPGREYEIKSIIDVTSKYDKALKWFFKFPYVLIIIIILIVASGISTFPKLQKSRLPEVTRNNFEISLDWNEYIDTEKSADRIRSLAFDFQDRVSVLNAWSGPQQYLLPIIENLGYTQNRLYLEIKDNTAIENVKNEILIYMNNHYPMAIVTFHPAKNAFDAIFADDKAPLTVTISDKNNRKMPPLQVVETIVDTLQSVLPDIDINAIPLYEKITLKINQEVASRYNIGNRQISTAIENILKNKKISDYQSSTSLVPLVLRDHRPLSIFSMLSESFVINNKSEKIPLDAVVSQERETSYKFITAGITGEYYPIDLFTNQPAIDLKKINKVLDEIGNDEVEILVSGGYFANKALINEMITILMVSILLLYFILAAQFESLIQPLFILLELPISIFGALLILFILDESLNLMAMIGIVVMSGLIINDSIIKIDAINQLRMQGVPLLQAIFEGGHKRVRSIIMISLTSIGALSPTLFMSDLGSELQRPLALALIGGMFIGLFISLFFVPIIYWYIYKSNEKKI